MQRIILTLALFAICQSLTGQQKWLPYKENGKWGYLVDFTPFITAEYDRISETKSTFGDYYLVWNDGKTGVINLEGEEVIPPLYDEVEILTGGDYFVLLEGNIRSLISTQGLIYKGDFKTITVVNTGQYFILNNGSQEALLSRQGELLLDFKYKKLLALGDQKGLYFAFQQNKKWGVLQIPDQVIVPPSLTSRPYYSRRANVFYQYEEELSKIFDTNGRKITEHKGKKPIFLSPSLFIKRSGYDASLYNFYTKKEKSLIRGFHYHSLMEDLIFYTHIEYPKQLGAIDTLGKEVLDIEYTDVAIFNDTLLQLRNKAGLLGLYDIKERAFQLKPSFHTLKPFNFGLLEATYNDKRGIVTSTGELVVPLNFERLESHGTRVKAFSEREMTIFDFDENGTITSTDVYNQFYTLRVGYAQYNTEKARDNFTSRARKQKFKETPNFSQVKTKHLANYEWKRINGDGIKYGLYHKESREQALAEEYIVKELVYSHISLIRKGMIPLNNQLSKVLSGGGTLSASSIVNEASGKIIAHDATGIAIQDLDYNFEKKVYISNDGYFYLINNQGEIATDNNGNPHKYTYIGKVANNGLRRFAIGGYWKSSDSGGKLSLGFIHDFINYYGIVGNTNSPFKNLLLEDAKWGYMDKDGKIIIAPTLDWADDFSFDRARAMKNSKMGLIDNRGNPIIDFDYTDVSIFNENPKYYRLVKTPSTKTILNQKAQVLMDYGFDKFGKFQEGLAAVSKDSLWGFIDKNKKLVIACEYQSVKGFSEGLTAVYDGKKWKYINASKQTKLTLSGDYNKVGNFVEGLAYFAKDSLYGYMDTKGQTVIFPSFKNAFDFQYGIARVVKGKRTGLINRQGDFILKPHYQLIFPFDENGLAVVEEAGSRLQGMIDTTGKVIITPQYRKIGDFVNGIAIIQGQNGAYGYIDLAGNELIAPQYSLARNFYDGIACVREASTLDWAFINKENKKINATNTKRATDFSSGYALLRLDTDEGFANILMNTEGKYVTEEAYSKEGIVYDYSEGIFIKKKTIKLGGRKVTRFFYEKNHKNLTEELYDEAGKFVNGIAFVKQNGRYAIIDSYGNYLSPFKFRLLERLNADEIIAVPAQFIGLATDEGTILQAPIFDRLEKLDEQTIRVERNDQLGYLSSDGTWHWEIRR